jgi:hypothetical protein
MLLPGFRRSKKGQRLATEKLLESQQEVIGLFGDSLGKAEWFFPRGGQLTVSNLCIGGDVGIVVISYRETEGF